MTKSRFSLSHCTSVKILEDSGQPPALATLCLVPNEQEDGWAPEPNEMLGGRDKSLGPGINHSTISQLSNPYSSHNTKYAIQALTQYKNLTQN
jgi:hypothetical protein